MYGRRGLGDVANCPSLEQLLGITDAADPCQNPAASLPLGSAAGSYTLQSGALATAEAAAGQSTYGMVQAVSPGIQIGSTVIPYWLLGIGAVAILLLTMGGRHR